MAKIRAGYWVEVFFVLLALQPVLAQPNMQTMDSLYDHWISTPDSLNITLAESDQVPLKVFVDIRSRREQQVSMIPGAITLKEFEKRFDENRLGDTLYIAYCTVGYRSGLFAEKYRAKRVNVMNLRGGVLAWAQAHRPFWDESGKETLRLHVYDKPWDFVPPEYESTY